MKFKSLVLLISILAYILAGCNIEDVDYVHHSIEVYGAKENGEGLRNRSETPIFIESDIARVEYLSDHVGIYEIFFTEEYLSNYDSESIIEEYNSEPRVEGLRIYSAPYWDMFEIYVDDEFLFAGRFPNGLASSLAYVSPYISHNVDGITLVMNMVDEDVCGISKDDEDILYKVLEELKLLN